MSCHDLRAWTVWGDGLLVLSESSPLVLRAFTRTGDGRKDIAEFYIISKGRGGQVDQKTYICCFGKSPLKRMLCLFWTKGPTWRATAPFIFGHHEESSNSQVFIIFLPEKLLMAEISVFPFLSFKNLDGLDHCTRDGPRVRSADSNVTKISLLPPLQVCVWVGDFQKINSIEHNHLSHLIL